jgi:Glycosyltransferase family 87
MFDSASKANHIRFWLSIGVFLSLCLMWLAIALNYPQTAWDFSMFYAVAHVPLGQIYDQQVIHEYGSRLMGPLGITYFAPYLRPAVGALPLRLLTLFPYWPAYWIFAAVQLAACVGILWLAVRNLGVRPGIAAGVAFFYPAMMGIVTGQDILVVALISIAGLVMLQKGNDFTAGLVLGFTTYKYNLFLFVPLLFVVRRCWRGLAGWITTAATLALLSVLLAPPRAYLQILQSYDRYAIGFSPAKMINLRGALWSTGTPLYLVLAVLIVWAAVYAIARLPIEQAFYTGQLSVLLAGYYVNWFDGTLLLVSLLWLIAPSKSLPRTPIVLLSRGAAIILLFGTLVWPFAFPLITPLMLVVFVMFCWLASSSLKPSEYATAIAAETQRCN